MIVSAGLLVLWTIILPLGLGLFPVRFMGRERRCIPMIWLCGWVFMTAIFQAVSVPAIINGLDFSYLANIYTAVAVVLGSICFLTGLGILEDAGRRLREAVPDKNHLLYIIPSLVLILIQLIAMLVTAYPDGDDAFYIGTSLTTLHTDSMYIYLPYSGASSPLDVRHALSPVPIFMAWLSRATGVHVTVLCHVYMGCFLLIMIYVLQFRLGALLFPEQSRNCWIYLFFVSLIYMFGNISIYTPETFAFTRVWQGKAMFGTFVVPFVFFFLILIYREEMDIGDWLMLFLLSMMGVFTTSTAVFTLPLLLGSAALLFALRRRNIRAAANVVPVLMPCAAYGLLYLILR